MIKTDVPAAEADAMAADGGARVLERVNVPGEGVRCTVEVYDKAAQVQDPADDQPRKRGRPKGSGKG